jgi:hypothetical protein
MTISKIAVSGLGTHRLEQRNEVVCLLRMPTEHNNKLFTLWQSWEYSP